MPACGAGEDAQRDLDALEKFGVTARELRLMADTWEPHALREWMRERGILKEVSLSQHVVPNATGPDESALGALRLPVYFEDEFGTEDHAAALPCTVINNWAGGMCLAPGGNAMHEDLINLCAIDGVECPEGWDAAVQDGIDAWISVTQELAAQGGAWDWRSGNHPDQTITQVSVIARLGMSVILDSGDGDGNLATTIVTVNDLVPGLLDDLEKCSDHAAGQFCQYAPQTVRLFENDILRNSTYANASSEGRFNFISNLVRHEFGHVAGLGHRGEVQLMASGNTPGIQDAFTQRRFEPTAAEMFAMCRYNPNGNGPLTPCAFADVVLGDPLLRR